MQKKSPKLYKIPKKNKQTQVKLAIPQTTQNFTNTKFPKPIKTSKSQNPPKICLIPTPKVRSSKAQNQKSKFVNQKQQFTQSKRQSEHPENGKFHT